MGVTYTVSTAVDFSASHSLAGYEGGCSRVHGHNWVLRVYFEFDRIDGRGLTIDYIELRSAVERVVLPRFDHRHLNDVPPFDRLNPTSERLAEEIFRLCRKEIEVENGVLAEVELWETPVDMVRYREG